MQKRRREEILCLDFDGILVDGVEELKDNIKNHFESHFAGLQAWNRPQFDVFTVGQILDSDGEGLIAAFSEEEI